MKKLILLITTLLFGFSCNRIMVREYESPLDPSYFKTADCHKNSSGSFIYSFGDTIYELSQTNLKKTENKNLIWDKKRSDILYPYGYLDEAVPYMLRDGMSSEEILTLLGKENRANRRFSFYNLSSGSELVLFKGTLNMPKGMKSLVIQGIDHNDNIKIPNLKNN